MGTLYDLLGALPDDNAEGLRTAFRKAAKATHPDLNPDNPEAALRFRQLVRAHDILSDAEQRATYDQLLAIALKPVPAKSTQVYEKVHRFASSTIAATIIAGILVASYTLMGLVSRAPVAAESTVGIASRPPAYIVAEATASDIADNDGRDRRASTALADEVFTTGAVAPIANARGPWSAGAGPVPHVAIAGIKSSPEPNVFGRKYATSAGLVSRSSATWVLRRPISTASFRSIPRATLAAPSPTWNMQGALSRRNRPKPRQRAGLPRSRLCTCRRSGAPT